MQILLSWCYKNIDWDHKYWKSDAKSFLFPFAIWWNVLRYYFTIARGQTEWFLNNMSFCCFWDHKPRSSWSSQVPGFKALTKDLLPQSENVWDCIENLFEARSREKKKKESALGVESRCCGGVHRRGKLACNHSILKVYRLGGHKIHCISLFTRRYRGGVPALGRVGGCIWFSMENIFTHMYEMRICIGGWGMCI